MAAMGGGRACGISGCSISMCRARERPRCRICGSVDKRALFDVEMVIFRVLAELCLCVVCGARVCACMCCVFWGR